MIEERWTSSPELSYPYMTTITPIHSPHPTPHTSVRDVGCDEDMIFFLFSLISFLLSHITFISHYSSSSYYFFSSSSSYSLIRT